MKRYFKPLLAAAILSAAACSPIDDPMKNHTGKEGELTISVSTEEPTRGMITERMLPDGSEMGLALFDNNGNIYMGKRYEHIYAVAENTEDGQIWTIQNHVFLGESEATLYAYYPYSRYSYDIRDVTVEANSYEQGDFMYGGPYTGLTADNRHVNIHLKHALGAVRVCTRRGTYDGPGAIRSLGVGGDATRTRGQFDVTQGKFTSLVAGGTIYPTTTYQLSDEPNVQDILLIPTGEPGNLRITMTVDDYILETTIPNFLLEPGKISQVDISVDWGKLTVTDVTVQKWYNSDRGTAIVPADYRVCLEGNQEGISIGTVIDNGNVTITAVPYISKDAKVNPVTFEGDARFSQQMNEDTGVRTITICELNSNVKVIFDGVSVGAKSKKAQKKRRVT